MRKIVCSCILLVLFSTLISCKHPHVCSFDQETVIAPTCTESGYTLHECKCGESKRTDYVLPADHAYSEWQIRTEATVSSEGSKERICTQCGYIEKETIPKVSVSIVPVYSNPNHTVITFPFDWSYYSQDNTVKLVPADVKIDTVEKTYTVKLDELPDTYDGDINTVIGDILKDNEIEILDFEDYNVSVFVKNDAGEYEPVPYHTTAD